MIHLILGGARSGKSRFAEQQCEESNKEVIYLATAQAFDEEMTNRIQLHKDRRPDDWALVEEPLCLAQALRQQDAKGRIILVDCLTLWVTNCLFHEDAGRWSLEKQALLEQLPGLSSDVVLVSNEVGHGIVPMGEATRRFVDESGWLHQEIASLAQRVTLVVAGLPHHLKSE